MKSFEVKERKTSCDELCAWLSLIKWLTSECNYNFHLLFFIEQSWEFASIYLDNIIVYLTQQNINKHIRSEYNCGNVYLISTLHIFVHLKEENISE